jgi:outer membrane protein assembly factor BamB
MKTLLLLSLFTSAVWAGAWSSWRGPQHDGTAPGAKPPVKFDEKTNLKWKVEVPGSGASTPIVSGGRVFVQTAVPTGRKVEGAKPAGEEESGGGGRRGGGLRGVDPVEEYRFAVLCLDRETGKVLWDRTVREELPHEGHHRDHGFSSHSPVTDGEHVYAWFGSRGLYCLGMDGTVKWSKDLGKMRTRNGFGEGTSPALSGDILVVNWDHEGEDFVAAFHRSDGRELWRQARDEETTWTTPLIVEHGGKRQVVVAATKRIRSYDLETGREVWSCGGLTGNVVPTPVAADGVVYALSGFRGAALLAIRLGGSGDLTETESVLWRHEKRTPYVPSAVLAGGKLYFHSGNDAYLSIVEAKDGRVLLEAERIPGMSGIYASPVAAGGHLYFTGRDGVVVVAKQSDRLEVVATNRLEEAFEASPAVAGNEIFLRGHRAVYCFSEKP